METPAIMEIDVFADRAAGWAWLRHVANGHSLTPISSSVCGRNHPDGDEAANARSGSVRRRATIRAVNGLPSAAWLIPVKRKPPRRAVRWRSNQDWLGWPGQLEQAYLEPTRAESRRARLIRKR